MKFWAYRHQNGGIQVKRLLETSYDTLDDLEYAKLEKRQGNNFIATIVDKPIEAKDFDEAYKKAKELLNPDKTILLEIIDIDEGDRIALLSLPQSQVESLKTLLIDQDINIHPAIEYIGTFKTAEKAAKELLSLVA